MMYARMPRLAPVERLAHLAPLNFAAARLTPADAAQRHQLSPTRVRAGMLADRPVYRMVDQGRWVVVFADTGDRFSAFTPDAAVAEARQFAGGQAPGIHYDRAITEPDQWTLPSRALLPMHRVALGDADGTVLYVSDVSGEIAHRTTARERRIAYAGAVLHWLYFTPFRTHGTLWTQTIIWLSAAGSVMCLLGLVWGVYLGIRTPYRGWMRWHHYSGLAFGVASFTWVFSGLLSMDPIAWQPGTSPTMAQREAFSGGPLRIDRIGVAEFRGPERVALANGAEPQNPSRVWRPKEIEITQFRGEPRLVVDDRPGRPIDRDTLIATAGEAMPGSAIEEASSLETYDSYYYDRSGELPLPVLRVRFADPARTWLYIDPNRGVIVRKEERLTRVNRWLYHGLHSLDFPWLYRRRPLWDIVVILLSLGGIASAVTSLAPAVRRLRRHAQRLYT